MKIHGFALVGLMLVTSVLEGLGVGLVLPLFQVASQPDAVTENRFLAIVYEVLGRPGHEEFVAILCLILFAFFLLKNAFIAFVTFVRNRFIWRNYAIISNRLLRCYLDAPYSFHLQRNSARLIRNLTQSVGGYFTGTLMPFTILLAEAFVVVSISIVLLATEPVAAITVSSIIAIPMVFLTRSLSRPLMRWGRAAHDLYERQISLANQVLGGIREVKVFGRADNFDAAHREAVMTYSENVERHSLAQELPRLAIELLAIGALLSAAAILLGFGRGVSEVLPVLGMFGAAAFRLMPSANRIGIQVNAINFNAAAFSEILSDLETHARQFAEEETPATKIPLASEISVNNIRYRYDSVQMPALNGVDMTVHRGEWVALVGPSGGGKSTLINVLLGLLEPESGEVRVDGVNISGKLHAWRHKIGFVPQDAFLIDDTLRHNIAFTLGDDIDEARLHEVAGIAKLDELIATLPVGFDTVIGERGVRLSGGQRQRLSIARGLYAEPEVLILDEATSALDAKTESDITTALRALQGETTIIVIAHRLSTVRYCDRIFWISGGRITDSGTFADLHNRNEEFRAMVSHLDVSVNTEDEITKPRNMAIEPDISR